MQNMPEIAWGSLGQVPHFGDYFNNILNIKSQQEYQRIFENSMKLPDVTQRLRYTNVDMKIYRYPRLHIKVICRRFHILAPFTFGICKLKMFVIIVKLLKNLQKEEANVLRKMQNWRINN